MTAKVLDKVHLKKALIIYYGTLASYFVTVFFSDHRLWGIGWWAYFHQAVPIVLPVIAVSLSILILKVSPNSSAPESNRASKERPSSIFIVSTIVVTIGSGLLFYFLRARVHFLGDGYQLLSRLADNISSPKSWDVGVSTINQFFYSLFNGPPDERALHAFQSISILCGIVLVLVSGIVAYRLFVTNGERTVFWFGILSGGYMLLFFGYVENYSMLITAIIVFLLIGLLSIEEKISAYWAIAPFFVAAALHIFGLLLTPALAFLLVRRTRFGAAFGEWFQRRRTMSLILIVLIACSAYIILRSKSTFYAFTLLAPTPDTYAVEGNWLFSFVHISDFLNLLIMLSPSVVFAGVILLLNRRKLSVKPAMSYLGIALVPTMVAIFAFNPRLGMPRDWDVFAVVGPPLVLISFYPLLKYRLLGSFTVRAGWLAIVLSLLLLGPRVASQVMPKVGLSCFLKYVQYDTKKNRTAWALLDHYPYEFPDGLAREEVIESIKGNAPEVRLVMEGRIVRSTGRLEKAAEKFWTAVDMNPAYADAWSNLGECYMKMGKLDSAWTFLSLADGINPYNANTLNNLGSVSFYRNDVLRAMDYWNLSADIDKTVIPPRLNLARAYQKIGDQKAYYIQLKEIVEMPEVPYSVARELGDLSLRIGDNKTALKAFGVALANGLDTSYVSELAGRYEFLLPLLDR